MSDDRPGAFVLLATAVLLLVTARPFGPAGAGAAGTGAVGIVTVTLQAKASGSQKRP
ncbi:hypothetical protein [Humibacter soli]